jgi:hypothetical protein
MKRRIYIKDTRDGHGTNKWEPWVFDESSGIGDVWRQLFHPYTTLTIDYPYCNDFYNMGITKDIGVGEPLKWIKSHRMTNRFLG